MKHSREHCDKQGRSIATETKNLYIKKLFTKIAPRYRFLTTMLSFGRDAAWKRYLVQHLPVHPNPSCLDIACGTGDLTFLLGHKYQNSSIIGLDITRSMLDHAHNRNTFSTVSFQHGDMCALPFQTHSFDIITAGYALCTAQNLSAVLEEVHRVLKSGGIFAFLDFSKHPSRFMHALHYSFLYSWGSLWGFVAHGDPSLYNYIAKNLALFPERKKVHELLEQIGLSIIHSRNYMGGMVEVTVCKKI